MKSLNLRINKGLSIIIFLSLVLAACGGGSVDSYSATPGDKTVTTPSPSPLPISNPPNPSAPLAVAATPFGSIYGTPQSVTLGANKTDATIYYTVNSTTPTVNSTQYTAPVNISANSTLKFIAKDSAGTITPVVTENYTIDTTSFIVNVSPAGGSYPAAQYIALSANKPGTTLYYTTDGSTPTTNSKIYTNPISTGINKTATIKFFGRDIAGNTSTVSTATYIIGKTITDIKIVNTGAAQTSVPVTFGQVFAVGELPSGTSIAGTLSDSTSIPLQVNVKATHADGSVRHAIISAVLPSLASGQTETISFTGAAMSSTTAITPATLLAAGFTASIDVTIGGVTYSASADTLLAGSNTQWLAGPVANEWIVSAPLKTAGSVSHPHLTARFAIRSYAGSNKTKVDVTVENNRTFTAGSQNFTYDAKIYVGGTLVDTIAALEHYHHARWHKTFWWNTTTPQVHLKHNIDYLIATKAVPNYDRSVVPSQTAMAQMVTDIAGKIGPMKQGLLGYYMPTAGGRTDIGPLPGWYALYLLSMDKSAKEVMLHIADSAGSWRMHYRDETDPANTNTYDMPVRIDKTGNNAQGTPYREINVHGNLINSGPLPVPRCGEWDTTPECAVPYFPDNSHQPSLAYLPYLVTGDYFYLEELQFWATWNFLGTGAGNRGFELGLLHWQEVRGQAWSMRTLGQAAYITPDTHPLKSYFYNRVINNLNYYDNLYRIGNANPLGVVLSTTDVVSTGLRPWQDDFFTWSIGYLTELGFPNAQPFFAWKSQFPIGRMTSGAGYCWITGSVYAMTVRPSVTDQMYATFGEVYTNTFGNFIGTDGTPLTSKACGSQAMADWLTSNSTNTGFFDNWGNGVWSAGQMLGYAGSEIGFPSNMQPALAVAALSGIPNAQAAWSQFMSRSAKPDYSSQPQFAIVPRN